MYYDSHCTFKIVLAGVELHFVRLSQVAEQRARDVSVSSGAKLVASEHRHLELAHYKHTTCSPASCGSNWWVLEHFTLLLSLVSTFHWRELRSYQLALVFTNVQCLRFLVLSGSVLPSKSRQIKRSPSSLASHWPHGKKYFQRGFFRSVTTIWDLTRTANQHIFWLLTILICVYKRWFYVDVTTLKTKSCRCNDTL